MRTIVIISILSVIFLNNCAVNKANFDGKNDYNEENHPVRDLFLSSIEAFNDKKLELFVANFAPEIKMYGTDGNYFGQNALRERFEILFGQFPNMKMEIPELNLKVLSKEVVLVNFEWKLFPMGQGPAFSGLGSGIYNYNGDKWIEILEVERTTDVDPALKQE